MARVENTGRVLWDSVISPIHTRLAALEIGEGGPVVLIPQAGVGLLPLHAAWREEKGIPRAFLDDYAVSYAPSAYALNLPSPIRGPGAVQPSPSHCGQPEWRSALCRKIEAEQIEKYFRSGSCSRARWRGGDRG